MTGLPGGSAAEALAAVLRRHGVRAGTADCARLVAEQAASAAPGAPGSLAALARAAGACGIAAEAFEACWDDLDDARLPAVVHLARGDAASFAVVVAREASALLLDAGDGRVTRLAREHLADCWQGIVLFCPSVDAARAEQTLRALPRDPGAGAPSVAADDGAGEPAPAVVRAARWLAAVLALAAAVHGGWRVGESFADPAFGRAAALLFVAVASLGLAATLLLARAARRTRTGEGLPALVRAVCREGALTDCRGVLASRWSSFLGVDFATWGAVFWGALFAGMTLAGVPGAGDAAPLFVAAGLACVAVLPVALLLVVVQIAVLRRVCALCMASHALVALGAACGLSLMRDPGAGRTLDAPGVAGALGLLAALAAAALAVAWAWMAGSLELPAVRRRLSRVLRRPIGALAELAASPRATALDGADGIRGGGAVGAPLRVDAFVHPACEACPEVVAGVRRLAARHAALVDVRVHLPRRDPRHGAEAVLLATLAAIAIDDGEGAFFESFEAVERDPWGLLEEAGGGRRALARSLGATLLREASLEAGRRSVAASTCASRELDLGTPALFVDRRPFAAPIGHLDALLADRPDDLLRELGAARSTRGLPA